MLPTVTSRALHSATSVTFTASGKPPRQLLSTAHWPFDSPDHHTMPSEGGDAGGEAEVADSAMNWWALTGCSDLRGRQRKATQADLSHYRYGVSYHLPGTGTGTCTTLLQVRLSTSPWPCGRMAHNRAPPAALAHQAPSTDYTTSNPFEKFEGVGD